jgi:galactonate dehydratase
MSHESLRITGLDVILSGTSWRNLTLVKVTTDAGIVGWGDATVEYREYAVAAHLEFLRHLVVGLDALSPAAVWQAIVQDDFMAGDAVGTASASGIVNACLDIAGKAYDVPVHQLLGGAVRERVALYANGWYQGKRTPETFASLAREVVGGGHRALKLDPFGSAGLVATGRDVAEAAELVGAVRAAVGPDVAIYVDAHGRLAPAMARRAAEALAAHDVGYLEEPVAPDNLDALKDLRATSPIPIAAGERCIGRAGFRPLIEGDCVDVIQPDASWAGGLPEVQRIAAWAELHGMVVSFHNANSPLATMTACHLAAVLPNFLVVETFDDFEEDWVRAAMPGMPEVVDGAVATPMGPGIGIVPDEDALADHPARPAFMNINVPGWELRQALVH